MDSTEPVRSQLTYDRSKFPAFAHFYIPADENRVEIAFAPLLRTTPPEFSHLVQSFKKNVAAVISTASMPFRIASANYSNRLFHQYLLAEKIRTLKTEFDDKSEQEKAQIAHNVAQNKYLQTMRSDEQRYQGGIVILQDLESLLVDEEMKLAVAELMRQSDALTWGILEVLANDLFINLLNQRPQLTEALLADERTKKRFQVRDMALPLSTYSYDLSQHMGDVFGGLVKIDDIETLRTIYEVLMPSKAELLSLVRCSELWKLNQRRNLILHRRSVIDETYLSNTGDTLPLGAELMISPNQFEKDLTLVIRIGSLMLESLSTK